MEGATQGKGKARSILDVVMGNPLVGLAPWILYSIVEGQGRLEISAALALGLALLVLIINWLRGYSPKALEFADVIFFGALAVVVAFSSADTRSWLELWGGEVANGVLFFFALGSVLIRQPFTLQYAKEDVPEEVWQTPEFLRVNYLISWVWVIAFGIEAASGLYGDAVLDNSNNIWTGWIIQTLPMIMAAQFTIWYPAKLEAVREGREETAPGTRELFSTFTPWITVIGVLTLFMGGAPEWLSIAFIVVGAILTKILSDEKNPAPTG